MVLYFTTTLDNQDVIARQNTMLRLSRTHRYRIPNQLAVLGALLLVFAAAAGINAGMDSATERGNGVVSAEPASEGTVRKATARTNKAFKVKLFLFRHK